MRLVIANTEIDIGGPDDLPLATTFEASDLFDPSKAKGDRSEEVEFPQTINNSILGDVDPTGPLKDRASMPAFIDDGAGVLWKGKAVPASITRSGHSWQLLGNNATWFDRVKDANIADLDLGETLEHTAANAALTWDLDNGYNYLVPLVDYGNLGNKLSSYDVRMEHVIPAVSAKAIADAIFSRLGLVPKYQGVLGAHLPRLFFLFSGKIEALQATQDVLDGEVMTMIENSSQPFGDLEFSTATVDPGSCFQAPGAYRPNFDMRADWQLTFTCTPTVTASYVVFVKRAGTNVAAGYFTIFETGPQTVVVTIENVSMDDGLDYTISISGFFTAVETAAVTITPINIGWQAGLKVKLSSVVPQMKQSDFLKGLFAAFDCKVDTRLDERTVTIVPGLSWDKPLQDADDWTDKVDLEPGEPAKVRGDIPAWFEFRCEEDANDLLLNEFVNQYGRGLGDMDRATTDENAIGSKEVKVPWAATQTGGVMEGLIVPRILDEDETDPDAVNYGWKPRLVYYADRIVASWSLDGVAQTRLPDVYFCRKSSTVSDFSLAFASNGGEYGSDIGLVDRIHYARLDSIEYSRYVQCHMHLTDEDVRTLDFRKLKLLRIEGSVSAYRLLKVDQYLWGQGVSTPCTFIEAHPHLPEGEKKTNGGAIVRDPPRMKK